MGQIDVGQRESTRHERWVGRIELPAHPIRPNPVEIVLDHTAVNEATRMHRDAGPQQLDRLGHFRGLSKALETSDQVDRIEESVAERSPTQNHLPRQTLHRFMSSIINSIVICEARMQAVEEISGPERRSGKSIGTDRSDRATTGTKRNRKRSVIKAPAL